LSEMKASFLSNNDLLSYKGHHAVPVRSFHSIKEKRK
jgi:hypothetical protein